MSFPDPSAVFRRSVPTSSRHADDIPVAGDLDSRTFTTLLVSRRLSALEDVVSLRSLGSDFDPFGHTNLARSAEDGSEIDQKPLEYRNRSPVTKLNLACQAMFGRTNGILAFTFAEDSTPDSKSCTLTIERPGGLVRAYSTKPEFSKHKDAQRAAAEFAIELGAIDFLQRGEDKDQLDQAIASMDAESSVEGVVKTIWGTVYAEPMDVAKSGQMVALSQDVRDIERCCSEWRSGKVEPHWLATSGKQTGQRKFGAMLEIKLSSSVMKVWSCDTTYGNPTEAKNAIAKVALQEGVLDFIRHGNGQQHANEGPQGIVPPMAAADLDSGVALIDPSVRPVPHTTLQSFVQGLPQPMPNKIGISSTDMNPIAWMNQVVQHAKVKIQDTSVNYTFVVSANSKSHGCIARVDIPPAGSRSWFVDAMFASRQDARTAVCLQAICLGGFDDFVRSAVQQCAVKQITLLEDECFNNGFDPPVYEITRPNEDFGAVLTITLSKSALSRKFIAKPVHPTATDAKAAVVFAALKEGIVEFVRTRGVQVATIIAAPKTTEAVDQKRPADTDQTITTGKGVWPPPNTSPPPPPNQSLKRPASTIHPSVNKKLKAKESPGRSHGRSLSASSASDIDRITTPAVYERLPPQEMRHTVDGPRSVAQAPPPPKLFLPGPYYRQAGPAPSSSRSPVPPSPWYASSKAATAYPSPASSIPSASSSSSPFFMSPDDHFGKASGSSSRQFTGSLQAPRTPSTPMFSNHPPPPQRIPTVPYYMADATAYPSPSSPRGQIITPTSASPRDFVFPRKGALLLPRGTPASPLRTGSVEKGVYRRPNDPNLEEGELPESPPSPVVPSVATRPVVIQERSTTRNAELPGGDNRSPAVYDRPPGIPSTRAYPGVQHVSPPMNGQQRTLPEVYADPNKRPRMSASSTSPINQYSETEPFGRVY